MAGSLPTFSSRGREVRRRCAASSPGLSSAPPSPSGSWTPPWRMRPPHSTWTPRPPPRRRWRTCESTGSRWRWRSRPWWRTTCSRRTSWRTWPWPTRSRCSWTSRIPMWDTPCPRARGCHRTPDPRTNAFPGERRGSRLGTGALEWGPWQGSRGSMSEPSNASVWLGTVRQTPWSHVQLADTTPCSNQHRPKTKNVSKW